MCVEREKESIKIYFGITNSEVCRGGTAANVFLIAQWLLVDLVYSMHYIVNEFFAVLALV